MLRALPISTAPPVIMPIIYLTSIIVTQAQLNTTCQQLWKMYKTICKTMYNTIPFWSISPCCSLPTVDDISILAKRCTCIDQIIGETTS
jgi:hypothetical protein